METATTQNMTNEQIRELIADTECRADLLDSALMAPSLKSDSLRRWIDDLYRVLNYRMADLG